MRRTTLTLLTLLTVAALLLAACGASHSGQTPKATAKTDKKPAAVDIYSGLPLHGVLGNQGRAIRDGIELAMSAVKRNPHVFPIRYISLDDTVNTSKKRRHPHWVVSSSRTATNAAAVAVKPRAVFYIGDLDSAATEISLQELNFAGIPQITPGSGYVGLTRSVTHVTRDDAQDQYQTNPTHTPTLLRLVPDDGAEAIAILKTIVSLRTVAPQCANVSIVSLSDAESVEIADLVYYDATDAPGPELYHVTPVAKPFPIQRGSKLQTIKGYEATVKPGTVGCFVIVGHVNTMTRQLTKAIQHLAPDAFIIGSSGLCNRAWTNAHDGGVAAVLAARLRCISPNLPLDKYRGSKQFETLYRKRYPHSKPSVYALYGYTAAEMAINAITEERGQGDNRLDLLDAVINRTDLLGENFYTSGDIENPWYALYVVAPNGDPEWKQTFKIPS